MGDVDDRVRALAARGLAPHEIAEELGLPVAEVRGALGGDEGHDGAVADSFPASDPPTSPAE